MRAFTLKAALVYLSVQGICGFLFVPESVYRFQRSNYYEIMTQCEQEGGECVDVDLGGPSVPDPPATPEPPATPAPTEAPDSTDPPSPAPLPPNQPIYKVLPAVDPYVPFVPRTLPPLPPKLTTTTYAPPSYFHRVPQNSAQFMPQYVPNPANLMYPNPARSMLRPSPALSMQNPARSVLPPNPARSVLPPNPSLPILLNQASLVLQNQVPPVYQNLAPPKLPNNARSMLPNPAQPMLPYPVLPNPGAPNLANPAQTMYREYVLPVYPRPSPKFVPKPALLPITPALLPITPAPSPIKIIPNSVLYGDPQTKPAMNKSPVPSMGQGPVVPNKLYFPKPPVMPPAPKPSGLLPTTTTTQSPRVMYVERELPESRQRRRVSSMDNLYGECSGGWEFDLGCSTKGKKVCCFPASARRRKR